MSRCTPLMLLFSVACQPMVHGEGPAVEESRFVTSFDSVVATGVNVTIRNDVATDVTVVVEQNLQDYVETVVEDGTLYVSVAPGVFSPELSVDIAVPALEYVANSDGSDLVIVDIDEPVLTIDAGGHGHVQVDGFVDELILASTGKGVRNLQGLTAETATVVLSGSGDTWLTVEGTIDGEVSGSGVLNVFGNPSGRDVLSTGSGDVVYY